MKIISPETKEELLELLNNIFGKEYVTREEVFEVLGICALIDKTIFLSIAGCKEYYKIEEIADVLWKRSNYYEAEQD